jgi:hypothetical protein
MMLSETKNRYREGRFGMIELIVLKKKKRQPVAGHGSARL